ncbi:MAG TPA: hypothetical protein VLJ39_14790 [Tepidisphaeraceae bacterium]|nr:hypothetical protein [Tepidisphaeraceae bacterium]
MKTLLKTACGAMLAGIAGLLAGCTLHAGPPEPVPAGYTVSYEPVYYDRGWYDGPNWYWYGPDRRLYHERREFHERRWRERDYHHYH